MKTEDKTEEETEEKEVRETKKEVGREEEEETEEIETIDSFMPTLKLFAFTYHLLRYKLFFVDEDKLNSEGV